MIRPKATLNPWPDSKTLTFEIVQQQNDVAKCYDKDCYDIFKLVMVGMKHKAIVVLSNLKMVHMQEAVIKLLKKIQEMDIVIVETIAEYTCVIQIPLNADTCKCVSNIIDINMFQHMYL